MASGAIGPTLGGALSDLFGWRSIFLVNLPIGVVVLLGLGYFLPYRQPHRRPKIDFAGALLLAGVISSIVLWADSRQIFGSLIAPWSLAVVAFGLACLAAWLHVERRVPEPIVPLTLFRSRTVNLLLLISLVSGAIGIGSVNYVALYLQTTTGLSPSLAGLLFIALTGGIAIGSLTAGRLMSITGRYRIFSQISTGGGAVAFALYFLLDPGTPIAVIGLVMLLQGISIGFGQQVPVVGVQNAADPRDVGAATGAVTLTRMAGASIAISTYGAVLGAFMAAATPVPGVGNIEAMTPATLATLSDSARATVAAVYAHAFGPVFATMSGLIAIGFVAALFLPNVRLPQAISRKAA
jgi:predicted MFS family arabinose efflux permease